MIKHKPLLFIVGFLFLFSIRSIAQQAVDISGGNATGAGGTVSYSVGQIDYNYLSGSNGNLNEGVQQPYEIFTSGVEDPAIQPGLSVYPNPTTHVLYLNIEKEIQDLSFQLFDANGKQLLSRVIVNNTTEIQMEQYAASTYFLKIYHSTNNLTTFTIIKK